ncbi:uncharacterized protein BX664DRAFT_331062 [Halteromyces radiatus]|uniref:uncharacterized protein n=1 Tax=Halteromyces radiatus TaxID=101107 RepID=UPI00221FE568|nr:uncharacterized protein BX664DRAFT_331062 [Halteromyces radiatus]KAI8088665.1 hypothetical protein BX664DRAFT_331062 [Halteromyces radiatus]
MSQEANTSPSENKSQSINTTTTTTNASGFDSEHALTDTANHTTAATTTGDVDDTSTNHQTTTMTSSPTSTTPQEQVHSSPSVVMLKEAFPNTDIDVIEAILDSHGGNVERSFEDLLHISDPNYQPEQQQTRRTTIQDDDGAPPMPPRPRQEPLSPEEQMRMDEQYAKELALEDERQRMRQHQSRQQQQQQQQQQSNEGPMDEFIKDLQEELPVIKGKMIEAGNAAKKKVMDWYNQVKTNRMNNDDNAYNPGHSTGSSMPTSNARYRGLPSDHDDDLLSGDMTALHLSDHDVYTQTGRQQQQQRQAKNFYDYQGSDFDTNDTSVPSNVIHVNSPPPRSNIYKSQEAQILADEEFARQLAQDDELWRQRQQQQETPPMPPRQNSPSMTNNNKQSPTVIVAPRSPLEEYDEQDNKENVPLNAVKKMDTKKEEDINTRSYVIGDYDDSDDGLVDLDDEEDQDVVATAQKSDEKKIDSSKH